MGTGCRCYREWQMSRLWNNKEHDVPGSTGAKGEASLRCQGRGPCTIGTRSVTGNPVPVRLIKK